MAPQLKQYLRTGLAGVLEKVDGAVVVHYQGLDSGQEFKFRKALRGAKAQMHVVKASIARVHCKKQGYLGEIDTVLKGPVALIVSRNGGNTPSVVKATLKLVQEYEKVKVRGAIYDGMVIPESGVDALSKMPTKEQLLSRLAGAFQGPTQQFAQALYEVNAKVAGVFAALQKKREDEGKA